MNGLDPWLAALAAEQGPPPAQQEPSDAAAQLSAFSQDELSWLEQQLSLAPGPQGMPGPPYATTTTAGAPPTAAANGTIPFQPHAFPPVSQARFHPYQLPADRAQRMLRPPGPHAQLNLLSSAAQLQQLALQQQQQQQQHGVDAYGANNVHENGAAHSSNGLALPAYLGADGQIDWSSFGSFGGAVSQSPFSVPMAVPAPQHFRTATAQTQTPFSTVPRPQATRNGSTWSSVSSSHASPGAQASRVLYPPANSPPTVLLPDTPTLPMPPAPNCSPATPRTNYSASVSSPIPSGLAQEVAMGESETPEAGMQPTKPSKRKRARSAPPPARIRSVDSLNTGAATTDRASRLNELFDWLDEQRWSFSTLFTALSDVSESPSAEEEADRILALEHRRRMEDFLSLDEPVLSSAAAHPVAAKNGALSTITGGDLGLRLLREARRKWAAESGPAEVEKGPNEVVRLWEELGALGRDAGSMAHAVRELHSHVHEGAVAGSVIRNITNRYGEAYAEANSDIKRLDAALSKPPDPHVTSAPREAAIWTGTLVIPTLQADVLQAWLSNPAHQAQRKEWQSKIDPEHMRIYSSLSPLDFHARGAELCRVILLRDSECMQIYGHLFDRLQTFAIGPVIALVDTRGFMAYDDQSLWHHAVQTYLQLCVRYPELVEGKEATITILPDLPPPVHPTALETLLIDRALHAHWDSLRQFLLASHGGLLRSAVRSFSGVRLTKFDLLSVCDDTKAVIDALEKSRKSRNDRILPYDPSISQIRNAWRQQALWDPTADLVVWSAATTHFLELSALYPQFGRGVRELPGLESIIDKATSSSQSPPKAKPAAKPNGVAQSNGFSRRAN